MVIPNEEREKETEEIFEIIMTENVPKLMSDIKPQLQEPHRTPSSISDEGNKQTNEQTKIPPRDIIFKL